jgi:hypothetical protein
VCGVRPDTNINRHARTHTHTHTFETPINTTYIAQGSSGLLYAMVQFSHLRAQSCHDVSFDVARWCSCSFHRLLTKKESFLTTQLPPATHSSGRKSETDGFGANRSTSCASQARSLS